MPMTTFSINESDVTAAQDALDASRYSAWFAGAFNSNSAEWTTDAESESEIDPDGTFNGTVGGRVVSYNFPLELTDLVADLLTNAGIPVESVKNTRPGRQQPEDLPNANLISSARRLPGHKWESYGTLTIDGTIPPQTIGTTPLPIDQWSDSQDIINLTLTVNSELKVVSPGSYVATFQLFIDPSLAPGTQWTYGATIDGTPIPETIGPTPAGSVKGSFPFPNLTLDQVVAFTIKADDIDKTFKLKDKTTLRFSRTV